MIIRTPLKRGHASRVSARARKAALTLFSKQRVPSCGVGKIYDGTFSGTLIPGDGVAADLLRTQGIALATEETFKDLFGSDFEIAQ